MVAPKKSFDDDDDNDQCRAGLQCKETIIQIVVKNVKVLLIACFEYM